MLPGQKVMVSWWSASPSSQQIFGLEAAEQAYLTDKRFPLSPLPIKTAVRIDKVSCYGGTLMGQKKI